MTRLCLTLLGILALARLPVGAEASYHPDPELERLVFFSVLEGLYELSLPDAVVDSLLAKAPSGQPYSFIPGCPICTPTREALRLYRQRPALADGRRDFGQAPAEVLAQLSQESPLGRTAALGRQVRQWVGGRIARLRLSPDELTAWRVRFEQAAKEGERQLVRHQREGVEAYREMWSCMLCDGAQRGCKAP